MITKDKAYEIVAATRAAFAAEIHALTRKGGNRGAAAFSPRQEGDLNAGASDGMTMLVRALAEAGAFAP